MIDVKQFSEGIKEWTSMLNAADPMFPAVVRKLAESQINPQNPDMVAWMVTYSEHIKPILKPTAKRMQDLMETDLIKDLLKE